MMAPEINKPNAAVPGTVKAETEVSKETQAVPTAGAPTEVDAEAQVSEETQAVPTASASRAVKTKTKVSKKTKVVRKTSDEVFLLTILENSQVSYLSH